MESLRDEVKQSYADGILNLLGNRIQKEDILKRIDSIELEESILPEDIAKNYCLFTERMLSTRVDDNGNVVLRSDIELLDDNFKNGIIECITQRVWDSYFYGIVNPRRDNNPFWIENKICDILFDLIGSDVATMVFFQNPGLMIERLQEVSYKDSNLLEYLNKHIGDVKYARLGFGKSNMGSSSEIVNCVEAISDCSQKLRIPLNEKEVDDNKSY